MKRSHKRKKVSRMHGRGMGTHGTGARKKKRGKGMRGGKGMSGTGKRADHRKTLVTNLYGNAYFGKQGITSKKTKKDTRKRINLQQVMLNMENYIKKGLAKKTKEGYEVDLSSYKILGDGEIKEKLIIKAKEASNSATEKIEKAGGKLILQQIKESEEQQEIADESAE